MISYSNWETVSPNDAIWADSDIEILVFDDDVIRKTATKNGIEVGTLLFSGKSYWVVRDSILHGGFPTEDHAKSTLDRLVSYSDT